MLPNDSALYVKAISGYVWLMFNNSNHASSAELLLAGERGATDASTIHLHVLQPVVEKFPFFYRRAPLRL